MPWSGASAPSSGLCTQPDRLRAQPGDTTLHSSAQCSALPRQLLSEYTCSDA